MNNKGFRGFTLAEVLITLGVIGVVAAMTMPVLINSYNKRVTETRLKKFYSVMNQAVQRAKVDYGDLANWDYTVGNNWLDIEDDNPMNRLGNQNDIIDANFREYFGKYISFTEVKQMEIDGKSRYVYYFKDGSAVTHQWYNSFDYEFFPKNVEKCIKHIHYERYGTCSFAFQFHTQEHGIYDGKFTPYFTGSPSPLPYFDSPVIMTDTLKDRLYNHTSVGCKNSTSGSGNACGLIIMLNNWQVPKDYPRKLAY